jgi:cytochrome c oxidase subunit 2
VNVAWFVADANIGSVYKIRCYELCGTGHALMTADLLVLDPSAFGTWLSGA